MNCGYHFSAKPVSFGKGQSAAAKAAYNARTQLDNERDGGKTKDYANHSEVLFEGIFAPEGAPEWVRDRNQLWNRAEAAERQKNGQPARNIDCAFPHQLDQQQREWMLKDFCREQFARKGMVADAVIHAPDEKGDQRNFHAHILLTMRKIDGDEFAKTKCREWNSKSELNQWKEQWAEKGAKALHRAGYPVEAERWRQGHKTLSAQRDAALARGDNAFAEHLHDREPTRHMGPNVTAMKRRGKEADRWQELQTLIERNGIRLEMRALESQMAALEKERAQALRQMETAAKADERSLRRPDSVERKFGDGARQEAAAFRQETRDARDKAIQDAWRNRVEEQSAEKVNVGARLMGTGKEGLRVADKATGMVTSLADYMSNIVSGHEKPVSMKDRGGELAGFIHDDPKLMKEQHAARGAQVRAEKEADLALERIEDDMKQGRSLSASDIHNLTRAHQETLRNFGDDGMRQLIEDMHKRNERYWSNEGRERERD